MGRYYKMIKIEFDEKSVFTYDYKNLTVHAWDHRDGKWEGPITGEVGSIKFSGRWQVIHFMEMLGFILEKDKKVRTKPNPNIEPPKFDVVTEGYDPDKI